MKQCYPSDERACEEKGQRSHEDITLCWGKGPRGRVAVFCAQLIFITVSPAPPENRSSSQVPLVWAFIHLKLCRLFFLSKTKEKDPAHSSFTQIIQLEEVSSAGVWLVHLLNLLHTSSWRISSLPIRETVLWREVQSLGIIYFLTEIGGPQEISLYWTK